MQTARAWDRWKLAREFAYTVWDPLHADVGAGVRRLAQTAARRGDAPRIARMRALHPAVAQLYDRGYDPPVDLATLARLPRGSVGREYQRFIEGQGLQPLQLLLDMGPPANFLEYVVRRAYKLHDIMHVVLGCDASALGEVRIVSYSLAQTVDDDSHAARLALLVLLLHLGLRRPQELPEALRLSRQWSRLGAESFSHIGCPLEDWFELPVEEARAHVLAPSPGRRRRSQ